MTMKVGILTFHRAHNYGAVLQCYALQEVLHNLGADTVVINYKQPFIDNLYKAKLSVKHLAILAFLMKIKAIRKYFHSISTDRKRGKNFETFRKLFLNCSTECKMNNIPKDLDRYVIGSDQVWGIHCTHDFDPVFWGGFERKEDSKLYGYAISGNGDYQDFLTHQEIRHYFNLFDDISFREKKIRDDMEGITGIRKEICLDPTLLTDECLWHNLINDKWEKEKYVVVYQIRRLKKRPRLLEEKAKEYASKHECQVINLTGMNHPVDDFVSIIKHAQCVFTSSFHATVFSVIFGTPFYSYKLYDGHDDRYESLLKELDLDHHLVDENSDTSETPIIKDIVSVKKKLDDIKADSIAYLKRIISED